jgi:RNA polymerase sigma-70 factor (ECF subfamily)
MWLALAACMMPAHGTPITYADLSELRAVVLRTALVLTRNRADAEDLVQTAFIRALDRSESLDADTNWPAWMKTVIRNLAVDLARRNQRWRLTELVESTQPGPASAESISDGAWSAVTPEQLSAAVDSIDAHYQTVYRMHHHEGASYAQMAEQLQIPVRTVGTRLHRARGRIRDRLLKTMATEPSPMA